MNALDQLSASIAHEINNPLAGILVYTQLLQKMVKNGTLNNDKALEILGKMELATTLSSKLVHNLLDFARQSTPVLKPVVVGQVIDHAIALIEHQALTTKRIIIQVQPPGIEQTSIVDQQTK
jgi:two-component system, NtrC family, sensor kinase